MGTGFYKLFERPNVELVDEGIHLVEPRGIVTRDGELHELDVIVLATGFDAQAFVRPLELIGPGGAAAVGRVGAGAARLPLGRAARASRTC